MGYIMEYILNLLALLSLISPCYILSVFFVRKKKPLIGGALALVKFFLTIRATQIWELIGVICIALNIFVFFKKATIPTAQA